MLKIGTVFSGIGAVEHALERIGIDYKIEFACDNGDVDVLSKKIEYNYNAIKKEITLLKSISKSKYKKDLISAQKKLSSIREKIENININESTIIETLAAYEMTKKLIRIKIKHTNFY